MGDMDILIMGIQEQAEHPHHQAAGAIGYLSSKFFPNYVVNRYRDTFRMILIIFGLLSTCRCH